MEDMPELIVVLPVQLMDRRTVVIVAAGVGAAIIVYVAYRRLCPLGSRSGSIGRFSRLSDSERSITDAPYRTGFLPSQQGPHFQGMPPSLKVENDYHTNIARDCDGDYANIECSQKSYIKAMKAGTIDKADLICSGYEGDEDAYYGCLDGVYGNRLWLDRFAGNESCVCPGDDTIPPTEDVEYTNGIRVWRRGMGTCYVDSNGKAKCFCPSDRPLIDRRMVDSTDSIALF